MGQGEGMPGPLKNARHERYAQGRAEGLSVDAAHAAAGYKPNRGNAARLNANESVKARIAELQARVAEKVTERTAIDAAWLLNRLAEESTADVADLYADNGSLKPVKDWPLIWRQGLVAGLEIEMIGGGVGTIAKVKLSDRVKRLELIGKHVDVQAFKEKVELSGGIAITVLPEDAAL